jgi:hypothetical protein
MACQCVKAIVAMRMLTEELGLKQHAPTPMSLNAKAVIDSSKMDRVSQQPRWLAARQATLRQMIADHITCLVKVSTDLHVPDFFTKPVTDPPRLRRLREALLGSAP